MTKPNILSQQLLDGLEEMEVAIERLRDEIQRLQQERDALTEGNLKLYRDLTRPDF